MRAFAFIIGICTSLIAFTCLFIAPIKHHDLLGIVLIGYIAVMSAVSCFEYAVKPADNKDVQEWWVSSHGIVGFLTAFWITFLAVVTSGKAGVGGGLWCAAIVYAFSMAGINWPRVLALRHKDKASE